MTEKRLRPIEALAFPDLEIAPVATDAPCFEWVNPSELLVDETYQRNLSDRSIRLIRKIIENWDWARFKTPIVVNTDGQLHVIDGQHTAIGAVTRGIEKLPVMIVQAPEAKDRARAFVGHNRDRLTVTPNQIYFAELAAGDDDAVTINNVCERAGVKILKIPPAYGRFKVGETMAISGVRKLVSDHGAMNARQVLQTLVEAKCAPISADQIKATAELLLGKEYKGLIKPQQISDAWRAWAGVVPDEAAQWAAARKLPLWRALVVAISNRSTRRGNRSAV